MRMLWQQCLKTKPTCVSFKINDFTTSTLHVDVNDIHGFPLCPSEHRYVELFLNSTAGGSNGAYGSQMMGGMGEYQSKD